MKNIFISLTTLLVLAGCANAPTAPEDVDELVSIEMMLRMVDDTDVPTSLASVSYLKNAPRDQSFRNRKPNFRVVIHRLQRYVQKHPLSDETMHRRVLAGLERAKKKLIEMSEGRKDCRATDATVVECSQRIRPVVKDTRQLLHRIIMAVRSDRRGRRGRSR